jgi:hypothetical protein
MRVLNCSSRSSATRSNVHNGSRVADRRRRAECRSHRGAAGQAIAAGGEVPVAEAGHARDEHVAPRGFRRDEDPENRQRRGEAAGDSFFDYFSVSRE